MKNRVFLIDRHGVTREGMRSLLRGQPDFTICGESDCCQAALPQIAQCRPNLVVMEVVCRTGVRTDVVAKLRQLYPDVRIFILSVGNDLTTAERLLRAGANGYLSKDHAPAEVLAGIREVLRGEVCVARVVKDGILRKLASGSSGRGAAGVPVDEFSERERQIFRLIGEGRVTCQIANQLHLSVSTIETYRQRLKEKIGVTTGAELVRCAVCWVAGMLCL